MVYFHEHYNDDDQGPPQPGCLLPHMSTGCHRPCCTGSTLSRCSTIIITIFIILNITIATSIIICSYVLSYCQCQFLQVARLNTNSVWNPSTKNLSSEECAPPSSPLGVLSTVVRSNKGLFGWELCSLRCVKHIVTQCNSALVKKILSDYNTLKQCYYQESFVRILLVCIEISTMLDYPTHLWHIIANKIYILISEAQSSQCDDTLFSVF